VGVSTRSSAISSFLAITAAKIGLVVKDIIQNPNMAGDLKSFFIDLSDRLVDEVLSDAEVAAALTHYFGAEEAAEER